MGIIDETTELIIAHERTYKVHADNLVEIQLELIAGVYMNIIYLIGSVGNGSNLSNRYR